MNHESIILELMSRIKELERKVAALEEKAEVPAAPPMTPPAQKEQAYGKMTDDLIDICYDYGLRLNQDPALDIGQLANQVAGQTGMNRNSAFIYIYVVDCMLSGQVYKRAINTRATERYLARIEREQGQPGLKCALKALKEHVDYRQTLGHAVDGLSSLYSRYARLA